MGVMATLMPPRPRIYSGGVHKLRTRGGGEGGNDLVVGGRILKHFEGMCPCIPRAVRGTLV